MSCKIELRTSDRLMDEEMSVRHTRRLMEIAINEKRLLSIT